MTLDVNYTGLMSNYVFFMTLYVLIKDFEAQLVPNVVFCNSSQGWLC